MKSDELELQKILNDAIAEELIREVNAYATKAEIDEILGSITNPWDAGIIYKLRMIDTEGPVQ